NLAILDRAFLDFQLDTRALQDAEELAFLVAERKRELRRVRTVARALRPFPCACRVFAETAGFPGISLLLAIPVGLNRPGNVIAFSRSFIDGRDLPSLSFADDGERKPVAINL